MLHCCDEQCGSSIIDLSTPDTLQRDFNNWLNQPENDSVYGSSPGSGSDGGSEGVMMMVKMEIKEEVVEVEREEEEEEEVKKKKAPIDGRKMKKKGSGTNLYGRPYCPGRPLSMDERQKIINLHSSGMKVNAISKELCISHGCVSKIISRFRTTGVLLPACSPEQRKSRKRKTDEHNSFLRDFITDTNGNDFMNMYPVVQVIPQLPSLPSYYPLIS